MIRPNSGFFEVEANDWDGKLDNMGNMGNMSNTGNVGAAPRRAELMPLSEKPMEAFPKAAQLAPMIAKLPPNSSFPLTNTDMGNDKDCGYKNGELPECAPLAVAFVPKQKRAEPRYDAEDALRSGTLFPGLDLPFMNIANKGNPYAGTQLGELMAIGFVVQELTLFLDTHPDDAEAFTLLRQMLRLKAEAHRRYTERYGALMITDLENAESFNWAHTPWPWESKMPTEPPRENGKAAK
jgi:spore coat protein JB